MPARPNSYTVDTLIDTSLFRVLLIASILCYWHRKRLFLLNSMPVWIRVRLAAKIDFVASTDSPTKWSRTAADTVLPGDAILRRLAGEPVVAAKPLLVAERTLTFSNAHNPIPMELSKIGYYLKASDK